MTRPLWVWIVIAVILAVGVAAALVVAWLNRRRDGHS
jgi:hypothetical protein